MNVLIVDDQISVIASLKSHINWERLQIANVYTALNTMEARSVITSCTIDIMLCDIEMPAENGLSLLRWCRSEGYKFECIFLTSHADFFYAQEAIQLGSFDYILQPARYEDIEAVLLRTIKHIDVNKKRAVYEQLGEVAYSQKHNLLKNILHGWLSGTDLLEDITPYLAKMNIDLKPDASACLMMLQITSWKSQPMSFSQWSDAGENLLVSIFSHYNCRLIAYCPDKVCMVFILYGERISETLQVFNQSRLSMIQARFNQTLSCNTALYVSPVCSITDLPLSAKAVQKEYAENILLESGIFQTQPEYLSSPVTVCAPERLDLFRLYLTNYQAEKAEQDAISYLEELNLKNLLNQDTLLAFCYDYLQAAYTAARDIHLHAHMLPSLDEFIQISGVNYLNLQLVQSYISQLIDFFHDNTQDQKAGSYNLAEIEKYVNNNLDKPLLCTDVAKAVHLSPDYITRLFQNEKGISLKEYITQSKMLAARRLLITTALPVSIIASKVGYDNFSHFSKVYKKVLGHSPSRERGGENT